MPLMVELPPNGGPILSKGGAVHVAISRIFGLGYASGVGVWRIWDDLKQRDPKIPQKKKDQSRVYAR